MANRKIDRIRSQFTVTLANTVRAPYRESLRKANWQLNGSFGTGFPVLTPLTPALSP